MKAITEIVVPALKLKYFTLDNPVFFASRYMYDDQLALFVRDDEDGSMIDLSVNLGDYGLIAPDNHIYVKDYSENEGTPDALEAAGVATKVSPVTFGFGRGWLMRLTVDVESKVERH